MKLYDPKTKKKYFLEKLKNLKSRNRMSSMCCHISADVWSLNID